MFVILTPPVKVVFFASVQNVQNIWKLKVISSCLIMIWWCLDNFWIWDVLRLYTFGNIATPCSKCRFSNGLKGCFRNSKSTTQASLLIQVKPTFLQYAATQCIQTLLKSLILRVLNRDLAKNLSKEKKTKKSWKFVYILAK